MKCKIVVLLLIGGIAYESAAVNRLDPMQFWADKMDGPPRPWGKNNRQECPRCACGNSKVTKRIIGGEAATVEEFPWMALVISSTDLGDIPCGCAILDSRHLLTAAHCFPPNATNTRVVAHLTDILNPVNIIRRPVEQIMVHADFNATGHVENDIAILRIKDPFDFSKDENSPDYVCPVCLGNGDSHVGEDIVAIGWGQTIGNDITSGATVLQKVIMPIIDDQECIKKFGNVNFKADKHICVGTVDGSKGTCQGDSGGPLNYRDPATGVYYDLGVVSYGAGNCTTYSAYTDAFAYRDWITQQTESAPGCTCTPSAKTRIVKPHLL